MRCYFKHTTWICAIDRRVCEDTGPPLAILRPLVLAADLVFLLRCEVVLDVERLADLLGRLALDHVCDGLAANVQKGLDVKIVGCLSEELVICR